RTPETAEDHRAAERGHRGTRGAAGPARGSPSVRARTLEEPARSRKTSRRKERRKTHPAQQRFEVDRVFVYFGWKSAVADRRLIEGAASVSFEYRKRSRPRSQCQSEVSIGRGRSCRGARPRPRAAARAAFMTEAKDFAR